MSKCAIFFLLICCVVAQGKMVNRYSFTDGDTIAVDSISSKDGILTETATISGNRLVLDGSSAVELPSDILDPALESVTIELWMEVGTASTWARAFDFGDTSDADGGYTMYFVPNSGPGDSRFVIGTNGFPSWQTGEESVTSDQMDAGVYTHIACVYDGSIPEIRLYQDGELQDSMETTMDLSAVARVNAFIGDSSYPNDPYLNGTIDEFRIYDTALTDDEVLASFNAGTDVTLLSDMQAQNEDPENGALDVLRDYDLSWTPGIFADKHNVYFGTDFNDVNDGIAGVLLSEGQYANTYDPGRLIFGMTYYWRIDEMNRPPDRTIYRGPVWSFTVEPEGYQILPENITSTASSYERNAYSENTVNDSGIDINEPELHSDKVTDMWISSSRVTGLVWIKYEFDKLYKLHQILVWNYNGSPVSSRYGFRDVKIEYSENDQNWTELTNVPEFARAPGSENYEYNTVVDFNGIVAKYVKLTANSNWDDTGYSKCGLSEVRFLSIPVHAREPYPVDINDVPIDVTLSWRAGREAIEHEVYYSTNLQAVKDNSALMDSIIWSSYGPLSLDLSSVYYWRIDEVNNSETPMTWIGDTWSFRTQDYRIVDDFEDYNDNQPDTIWNTWSDGWENNNNGSVIGYPEPDFEAGEHFVETEIVHGGGQSAPIIYNNRSAAYSEVSVKTADLPIGTNWSVGSPETLVLWFYGNAGNTPAEMYVKINNNTPIPYPGDIYAVTQPIWRQWNIDITGYNLNAITSLAIGLERTAGILGDESTVFVDEIRLYREAPPFLEQKWIEAESGTITEPLLIYDDDSDASSGQYIGQIEGNGNSPDINNPPTDGTATYTFEVDGGVYNIQFLVIAPDADSDSFWVRFPEATEILPGTNPTNPDWILFNNIQAGSEWHFDEVHSADHNNQVINVTLPIGTNTMQIAYREDGALLDAILITYVSE